MIWIGSNDSNCDGRINRRKYSGKPHISKLGVSIITSQLRSFYSTLTPEQTARNKLLEMVSNYFPIKVSSLENKRLVARLSLHTGGSVTGRQGGQDSATTTRIHPSMGNSGVWTEFTLESCHCSPAGGCWLFCLFIVTSCEAWAK